MLNHLERREVFHIAFLRQLSTRLKPNSYAVKGGTNLRFFFGSIRYSEDMDIDVRGIESFRLKEIVMGILTSKTLSTMLRPFNIESIIPPDMKVAKQTETTQRFKVHLITSSSEDLFTKVEFSRRRLEPSVATESISDALLSHYKLPPLLASHYLVDSAAAQKIRALADRCEPQARDIFDLYMLIPRLAGGRIKLENISKGALKNAYDHIFDLDFGVFRDTVLNYLSEEDQKIYGKKEVFEEIQLKVGQWLR